MADLRIESLVKRFAGRDAIAAVDHVSITVEEGMLLVLLGPSGCGKTTLLRCVAGLEDAQEGKIALGGREVFDAAARLNIPTHKRDIGIVFQNYSLWPHMTVRGNVDYPLRARHVSRSAREKRADEVLAIVQCGHLSDRLPSMLSGGQQQRIALARALAPRPSIMLLDEPLSNLDAVLRLELRAQLRAIHRELGFTGIYVTHDQSEAFALGSRVAVMNSGRVEQLGLAPDVYGSPATEYVAKFLGIRNVLDLDRASEWSCPAGALRGDLSVLDGKADSFKLYVRPEHVELSRKDVVGAARRISLPQGRVVDALYGGGIFDYVVNVNGITLYAQASATGDPFRPDEVVYISLMHDDALLYADGRLIRSNPRFVRS